MPASSRFPDDVSFQYPSLLSLLSPFLKLKKLEFSSISTEAGHGPRLRQNKEEIIYFYQFFSTCLLHEKVYFSTFCLRETFALLVVL
jgi:hypothetical protein